jgi:hypothetical protein
MEPSRGALPGQITSQAAAVMQERERTRQELPRALMPWGAYLEIFPREIAHALGPLLRRLDLIIGPLRVQGRQGEGEPDGFRGIARRGNYDRLLLSEWMLAEAIPEEFARRAVMGEHGFLEIARRQPIGAQTSVALFDAGPSQLGSPRIAHVAALIILARRAEAAGACFQWGALQQPSESLHTDVTASTILHLLQARSPREATEEDIASWRDRAGSQIGADDLWIVGGRRLSTLPATAGASRLQISDPPEPEASSLTAEILERGSARPAVTLELPEEAICIRLLRDPFLVRIAEPSRASQRFAAPTSNLLFAKGGTRLLARSGQNHLVVYPIPNLPQAGAGKPKVYHAQNKGPILAAGRVGKSLALVTTTQEPDVLLLECVGPRSSEFRPIRFALPPGMTMTPPEPSDLLNPCYYLGELKGVPGWLVVLEGRLLCLRVEKSASQAASVHIEMEPVQTTGSNYNGCCSIGQENLHRHRNALPDGSPYTDRSSGQEQSRWALISHKQDGAISIHRRFDTILHSHFGYGGALTNPEYGLAALEESAGNWTILYHQGEITLHPSSEDLVVGVVVLFGKGIAGIGDSLSEPGLIVLQEDRRNLMVMGRNWTRGAPRASSEIVQITASAYGPEIAYLTAQGELVIYSLQQEAVLYRLETRPTP